MNAAHNVSGGGKILAHHLARTLSADELTQVGGGERMPATLVTDRTYVMIGGDMFIAFDTV